MTTLPVSDGWITLATPPRKPHEKEHALAWLDRVLGLTAVASRSFRLLAEGSAEVCADGGPVERRELAPTRVEVLGSLALRVQARSPGPRARGGDGGAVLLCDEARSQFLLTRKDDRHPNPRCRGKLALVGGALERAESFRDGALRELHEEVRDLGLVDTASALLVPLTTAKVAAVQWAGSYRLGVFMAAAPPELFARWRESWSHDDVLSEATPLCLDRATLAALIAEEDAHAGAHFVASHHILRQAL